MKNYKLIPKITLIILMLVGIIVSVLFYVGGSEGSLEVAGDFLDIPKYSNLMLYWNYALIALVCVTTLGFVLWKFFQTWSSNRKKAISSLLVVVCFAALVLICWSLGSEEEVRIIGYEGTDNVGTMAKMSDACMYMTYILTAGTLLTMVWGIIYTKSLK